MSRIGSVSSVVMPSFIETAAKQPQNKKKVTATVGVKVGNDGRPKATATTGVSVKSGRGRTSASVKVNEQGKVTATVGQEVTIPVGDSQVKLGAKVSVTRLLSDVVHGLFWLFGNKPASENRR